MNYNYVDCLLFVRNKLKVQLYPYQEEMLRAFCEGKEVRSARCIGRSYVADVFGKYIAYVCDRNNYSKQPDVVFPYTCGIEYGLISKSLIDEAKDILPYGVFVREYLCE